ncbi:MAG: MFS transporter [Sphingomonadaceae bacterium]
MGAVKGRLDRAEAVWTLTESANEPWFNLVNRYVFAPYFAGTLAAAAGPGVGAALWGTALGAAGLAIALLAPVIGSIADSGSRLKPWLAVVSAVAFLCAASLWFAAPGVPLLPVLVAVFVATVAVEFMNQFVNALLPSAASRPGRMGLLSGLAFGLSQVAGIAVLLIILALSRAEGGFLADVPNGVDRMAGPIAAAGVLLFLTPFLLIGRDREPGPPASVRKGLRDLLATLKDAWSDWPVRLFLIARMVAADGMTVVFAFGAVLAAATFGWQAGTLAIFGLGISLFGAIGGFLAGWLDLRIGSRAVVIAGLVLLSLGTASVLLTDETRLFGVETGRAPETPLSTPQEYGFLVAGMVIAAGAAFAIAGMRTFMAQLAPPAKLAAYFGLYAFVGKATAFVGPLIVGLIAAQTGSVRGGIAVALVFLLAGLGLFLLIRSPKTRLA